MHELKMNLEYNIGDIVYVAKKEKMIEECPICVGSGEVKLGDNIDNMETFRCPKCFGSGKLYSKPKVYVVVDNPCVVKGVKVELEEDGTANVTFKVTDGKSTFNRKGDKVFPTLTDALMFCEEMNNPIKMVGIDEIKILGSYNESSPSPVKVAKKMAEYQQTGKLKPIEVNRDMELLDGYITYKIANIFNIKEVEVKVVEQ